MKSNAALVKSLLLIAPLALLVPLQAKPQGKVVSPQAPAAAAKDDSAEADVTLPGTVLVRPNGKGFLSLTIEGNGFKLAFYDAKKKQIPCDVAKAAARWRPNYKTTEDRKILLPSSDGKTLESSDVRPPYNFKLFLTLLSEDGQAVESYGNIDFRG